LKIDIPFNKKDFIKKSKNVF